MAVTKGSKAELIPKSLFQRFQGETSMHVLAPSLSFLPSNVVSPFSLESNQSVVLLCSFLPREVSTWGTLNVVPRLDSG